MRTFITTVLVCLYFSTLSAQPTAGLIGKPPIDTADILHWPVIPDGPNAIISNDGKYLLYRVWHIPPGSASIMLRAVGKDWETTLTGARQTIFTNDSRSFIFITPYDSLCIMTLPDMRCEYEENVTSFKLFMNKNDEMLIYQRAKGQREVVLQKLSSSIKHTYKNIENYTISEDGENMLLQTMPGSAGFVTLLWVDIRTKEQKAIWRGCNPSNLRFDRSGKQLAFLVTDSATKDNTLWLYKAGQKNAFQLPKPISAGRSGNIKFAAIDNFNYDGKKLFLQIAEQSSDCPVSNSSSMTIWNYTDPKLQTVQANEKPESAPSCLAILDIESPIDIWPVQHQNESIAANNGNDLIVITTRKGSGVEKYWNRTGSCKTFLAMINEKKRIPIAMVNTSFSPDQKYLLGNGIMDTSESDLYVYEIASNTVKNITKDVPALPRKEENDMIETIRGKGLLHAGWLPADTGLLLYDDYDIWQVDPAGKRKAIRLTNGREQKIRFRLAGEALVFPDKVIQPEQGLFLTAFDTKTKKNGFYRLKWGTAPQPDQLFMGNYFFSKIGASSYFLKARDRKMYFVRREQVDQSPNIFSTTDFRSFSRVTQLHPERSANWFTSELITFTTDDGTEIQAILYKPENFSPANKYPLLINYYDKTSDDLNKYRPPQGWGNETDLDVAWFTSHGYLVLLTDIRYNIGKPGESIYKAVVGAAKYIAERPYVDVGRIGIQGQSFGGYETNFVVTHSNLFAAAVSSAGISDAMSFYGSLWPDGSSVQEYFEQRGFRIEGTPWHASAIFANNSPIFSVAHVNTPVLMVHNRKDKNVYFEQGLEFFTALRRAGKRVWMLQYDEGGHGQTGEEYKDFLIRSSQFFNHYLKGAPPPEWLEQGIPAAMKGATDGLSVDKDPEKRYPLRS